MRKVAVQKISAGFAGQVTRSSAWSGKGTNTNALFVINYPFSLTNLASSEKYSFDNSRAA